MTIYATTFKVEPGKDPYATSPANDSGFATLADVENTLGVPSVPKTNNRWLIYGDVDRVIFCDSPLFGINNETRN